jgi:hypothetical protein
VIHRIVDLTLIRGLNTRPQIQSHISVTIAHPTSVTENVTLYIRRTLVEGLWQGPQLQAHYVTQQPRCISSPPIVSNPVSPSEVLQEIKSMLATYLPGALPDNVTELVSNGTLLQQLVVELMQLKLYKETCWNCSGTTIVTHGLEKGCARPCNVCGQKGWIPVTYQPEHLFTKLVLLHDIVYVLTTTDEQIPYQTYILNIM